jgi:hypothetical protein
MPHTPSRIGRRRDSDHLSHIRIAAAVTRSDRERLRAHARAVDRTSSQVIRALIRAHLPDLTHTPPAP